MECLNVSAFRIGFSANLARFLLPFYFIIIVIHLINQKPKLISQHIGGAKYEVEMVCLAAKKQIFA